VKTKPQDRDSRDHPLPLHGGHRLAVWLAGGLFLIGHANSHADYVVLYDTTWNKNTVESAKIRTPRYYVVLYGLRKKTHLPHDRCVNCKAKWHWSCSWSCKEGN